MQKIYQTPRYTRERERFLTPTEKINQVKNLDPYQSRNGGYRARTYQKDHIEDIPSTLPQSFKLLEEEKEGEGNLLQGKYRVEKAI